MPAPSCRCPLCHVWYEGSLCWKFVMQGVVRRLVMLIARSGQRHTRWAWFRLKPVVQRVMPDARGSDRGSLCRRDSVPVWKAHAGGDRNDGCRSAEQAVAADRFAREIVWFLAGNTQRLRRLNGKALGGWGNVVGRPFLLILWRAPEGDVPKRVVPVPVVLAWYECP
jgi:hypothetical protein